MMGSNMGTFERMLERLLESKGCSEQDAPSEHDRLEAILVGEAETLGCYLPFDLSMRVPKPTEETPDVELWNGSRMFFIGDAKDSNNEVVHDKAVALRIKGYFDSFALLLRVHPDAVGHFVMATNDSTAAYEWAGFLGRLAGHHRLQRVGMVHCHFDVKKHDESTWLVRC